MSWMDGSRLCIAVSDRHVSAFRAWSLTEVGLDTQEREARRARDVLLICEGDADCRHEGPERPLRRPLAVRGLHRGEIVHELGAHDAEQHACDSLSPFTNAAALHCRGKQL